VDGAWAQNRQRTGISNSRIESECAFGEIMRRWSILNAPLQHDLAKAMLIFRVCCKLHNFCISERDPFAGMHGADDFTEPHNSAFDGQRAVGTVVNETSTGDGDPMPQVMWGQAPAKQRRHKWLLALKAAGLRRRTRRN